MTIRDPEKDFIRVNKILGKQPSIGFIPANQIIPWFFLTIISYLLTMGFFSLGLGWFFTVSFWFIVSWWLLTGNQPHLFTDQFRKPPGMNGATVIAFISLPYHQGVLSELVKKAIIPLSKSN